MTHLTRPIFRSIIFILIAVVSTGCLARSPQHLRLERSTLPLQTTTTFADAPAPKTTLLSAELPPPAFPALEDASTVLPAVAERSVEEVAERSVEEAAERTCPPEGTRVLLIGDSLSHGLGPAVRPLAERCGTVYFHHGVIGSHVTEWDQDAWLGQQLRRAQPTVVIMSMGGNDFQRLDAERVKPAIERVIARVEASGAQFLWISPPTMPFADRIDVRGMWADTLADHATTATFPAHELDIPRVADRVHPTRTANHQLARQLWTWMANLGIATR